MLHVVLESLDSKDEIEMQAAIHATTAYVARSTCVDPFALTELPFVPDGSRKPPSTVSPLSF